MIKRVIYWCFLLLLFIMLTYFRSVGSIVIYSLLFFIVLIGFVAVWIFLIFLKRYKLVWQTTCLLIAIFVLSQSIGCICYREFIKISKERAYIIIRKIEQYYSKNKKYPQNLKQLIPDYLDAIPKPVVISSDYNYDVNVEDSEKGEYYLCLYVNGYDYYLYSFNDKKWSFYYGN